MAKERRTRISQGFVFSGEGTFYLNGAVDRTSCQENPLWVQTEHTQNLQKNIVSPSTVNNRLICNLTSILPDII